MQPWHKLEKIEKEIEITKENTDKLKSVINGIVERHKVAKSEVQESRLPKNKFARLQAVEVFSFE